MADLFTHVLVAYVLATACAWRFDGISSDLRTVAMIGAITPDFNRMEYAVPPETIESVLGVPFSWSAFHTVGGIAFVGAIGAALVAPRYRIPVVALLALGGCSHLVLDTFLFTSTGYSQPYLWPLTDYRFGADGFYKSYDRWPLLLASLVAACVRFLDRRLSTSRSSPRVSSD